MTRKAQSGPLFYRVEVLDNLFGEYSVSREWGKSGRQGKQVLVWFSNIRDACGAADRWCRNAQRRGYERKGALL